MSTYFLSAFSDCEEVATLETKSLEEAVSWADNAEEMGYFVSVTFISSENGFRRYTSITRLREQVRVQA